jgi:putative Holliday junction resolvase
LTKGRIVAIDVGRKRLGVAWSDPTGTIAVTLGTFHAEETVAFLEQRRAQFTDILVGWPIDLQGQEGEAVEMAKAFEKRLKNKFKDKIFHRFDERFTTVLAQRAILDSGVSKSARRDKSLVDGVAASILLQNYLEYLKR